jgi:hypothetical protein
MEYANKVIGDDSKDVKVFFSSKLNGVNGTCYPFLRTIIYCDGYMKLNQNNIDAIKYTVIEECAHLIRLPHDEMFYNICRNLGCDVSIPPPGIKYYWKYFKQCESCGDRKFYNHKPHNKLCKKCGNATTIFFGDGS